jgi:hypothetical protein
MTPSDKTPHLAALFNKKEQHLVKPNAAQTVG